MNRNSRIRRAAAALVVAAGLVLAPIAALGESGEAVVLEKDMAARTLTLDGGIVLRITGDTRIENANGESLTLESVPSARLVQDGIYEVSGDETVRYSARREGTRMMAELVRVVGTPLQ